MRDDHVPPPPRQGRSSRQSAGGQRSAGTRGEPVTFRKLTMLQDLRRRLNELTQERDQQDLVLHINQLLLNNLDPEQLFGAISTALWERTHHDCISLTTLEPNSAMERVRFLDLPLARGQFKVGDSMVPESLELAFGGQDAKQIDILGRERIAAFQQPELARLLKQWRIQSICLVPLHS